MLECENKQKNIEYRMAGILCFNCCNCPALF
uniref:Uncharacterized protein n=1 Tax=Arundo donax TaxID=35708 RepID=A0A0A9GWN2_ARUDO